MSLMSPSSKMTWCSRRSGFLLSFKRCPLFRWRLPCEFQVALPPAPVSPGLRTCPFSTLLVAVDLVLQACVSTRTVYDAPPCGPSVRLQYVWRNERTNKRKKNLKNIGHARAHLVVLFCLTALAHVPRHAVAAQGACASSYALRVTRYTSHGNVDRWRRSTLCERRASRLRLPVGHRTVRTEGGHMGASTLGGANEATWGPVRLSGWSQRSQYKKTTHTLLCVFFCRVLRWPLTTVAKGASTSKAPAAFQLDPRDGETAIESDSSCSEERVQASPAPWRQCSVTTSHAAQWCHMSVACSGRRCRANCSGIAATRARGSPPGKSFRFITATRHPATLSNSIQSF